MTVNFALRRVFFSVMIAAALTVSTMPARAAVYLSITADTRNQPNPNGKAPPDKSEQTEVVLGDDYIRYRSGNISYVLDFVRRRNYAIDESAKSYEETSLFAVVGMRELELRNRVGMHAALAAAKIDQKLPPLLEDEHELAVEGQAHSTAEVRADGDDEVFAIGDVALLRRSRQATPVSAAVAARFVQFLRYRFAGHPAVLAALQKEQRIPARLRYSFHPIWGGSTIDLNIALRQDAAAPKDALAGYTPRLPPKEAATLDDLLDRAWASRATLVANIRRPAPDVFDAQLRTQPPLDAYLMLSERQLEDGRMPQMTDEQKQAFQTDPAMQSLARAVSAKDPDSLRQAVGALEMLRLQAQSRRYLLSLFEANDRAQLGELVKARVLYTEVLKSNPNLASAYKDIGDFYYRSFDTVRAWRSWDVARTLAPLLPLLDPVTQYERTLATRFPEYF